MSDLLLQKLENINSREKLSEFISTLLEDFKNNKADWENQDLSSFLDAMSSWVESMDGYYVNRGERIPENIPWKIFGDILYAAKIYE